VQLVNRFLAIALTAITGIVLVACGPAASSGGPSNEASQAAASQAQSSSGGGPEPSFTAGAVADLEALIPDTVGGLTINKQSMQGSEFLTAPGSDPAAIKFVQDLGVSASDISIATGQGNSADFTKFVFVFVIRAAGVDSDRLVSAFKTATSSGDASPLSWSDATVAGKSVETAAAGGGITYIYAKGDVMFWVTASDAALAEQFIGLLP
jgi:hypothetical protein